MGSSMCCCSETPSCSVQWSRCCQAGRPGSSFPAVSLWCLKLESRQQRCSAREAADWCRTILCGTSKHDMRTSLIHCDPSHPPPLRLPKLDLLCFPFDSDLPADAPVGQQTLGLGLGGERGVTVFLCALNLYSSAVPTHDHMTFRQRIVSPQSDVAPASPQSKREPFRQWVLMQHRSQWQ